MTRDSRRWSGNKRDAVSMHVLVTTGRGRRWLLSGHPWLFENDVAGGMVPGIEPGDLGNDVGPHIGQGDARPGTSAEGPVRDRHDRVEVRSGHRAEHQDQHREPEHGGCAVLQQLDADIVG